MLKLMSNLRLAARQLEQGTLPSPELCAWLGNGFRIYLEHRCSDLEEALGLRFAKGGIPWWMEEAVRVRNAALCELATSLPTTTPAARAIMVKRLVDRYAATTWCFDRELPDMPARYRGTPHEPLWRAFRAGARLPLSERQLRNIVGGSRDA